MTLDLGFSAIYGKPVASVILERLPATLLLMMGALFFAFSFGMALGVCRGAAGEHVAGYADLDARADLLRDALLWFGLMAIVVFSVYLQWLPAGGFGDVAMGSPAGRASGTRRPTWFCRC